MSNNEKYSLDLSGLKQETKSICHRLLYRQECRAWILGLMLPCNVGVLNISSGLTDEKIIFWATMVYCLLIPFWLVYPSQNILAALRETSNLENRALLERRFDNTMASLWDFIPPMCPFIVLFLLIGIRLLGAI